MAKEIKSPFMQPEREQRMTSEDVKLLKGFEGHDEVIKLLRPVFYQDGLTDEQLKNIQQNYTPAIVKVIRKIMQPSLDWLDPIFDQGTRWIDFKPFDLLTSEVRPAIVGNQKAIYFIEMGLKRLEEISNGGQGKPRPSYIDIRMTEDYSKIPPEEVKTQAIAMQRSLTFLESGLLAIQGLAQRPNETEQEKVEKINRDFNRTPIKPKD